MVRARRRLHHGAKTYRLTGCAPHGPRTKQITMTAAFLGLLPIMVSNGTGADMMKRVAAPMIGGLATSFLLELLVYPAVYGLFKERSLAPASE
jgi:Cu(I)/Ag(I) efflux system membrane protein CusA/SilA